jgi:hypothetical protein
MRLYRKRIKTGDMRLGFYTSRSKSFDHREELLSRRDISEPSGSVYPFSIESVVSIENFSVLHKTARRQFENTHPAAFPHFGLKIGSSAAHDGFCLMLLGSPPDMVHSPPLRSTGLSSSCEWLPRRICDPLCLHDPC